MASAVYIGKAQGEERNHIKREAKIEPSLLLGQPPLCLEDVFSFACQIKRSCNRAITLVVLPYQIFAVVRQNQGNYTLPQHIDLENKE